MRTTGVRTVVLSFVAIVACVRQDHAGLEWFRPPPTPADSEWTPWPLADVHEVATSRQALAIHRLAEVSVSPLSHSETEFFSGYRGAGDIHVASKQRFVRPSSASSSRPGGDSDRPVWEVRLPAGRSGFSAALSGLAGKQRAIARENDRAADDEHKGRGDQRDRTVVVLDLEPTRRQIGREALDRGCLICHLRNADSASVIHERNWAQPREDDNAHRRVVIAFSRFPRRELRHFRPSQIRDAEGLRGCAVDLAMSDGAHSRVPVTRQRIHFRHQEVGRAGEQQGDRPSDLPHVFVA